MLCRLLPLNLGTISYQLLRADHFVTSLRKQPEQCRYTEVQFVVSTTRSSCNQVLSARSETEDRTVRDCRLYHSNLAHLPTNRNKTFQSIERTELQFEQTLDTVTTPIILSYLNSGLLYFTVLKSPIFSLCRSPDLTCTVMRYQPTRFRVCYASLYDIRQTSIINVCCPS